MLLFGGHSGGGDEAVASLEVFGMAAAYRDYQPARRPASCPRPVLLRLTVLFCSSMRLAFGALSTIVTLSLCPDFCFWRAFLNRALSSLAFLRPSS